MTRPGGYDGYDGCDSYDGLDGQPIDVIRFTYKERRVSAAKAKPWRRWP